MLKKINNGFYSKFRIYKNKCNYFCNINNEQEIKYSLMKLKNIMEEVEGSIQEGTYKLKEIPISNYFGEILLYSAPISYVRNNLISNIEFTALGTISTVSFLNYFSMLFPSNYIFYSFILTNLSALSKFIWKNTQLESFIYKMTLVSLDSVKITYFNGKSEIIPISKIFLSSKMSETLLLWNENKKSIQTQNIPLETRINGKKNGLIVLFNNRYFYSDLNILMAILNKNTHNLTI